MPRCPVMSKARVSFPAGGGWSEGRKPLGLSGCRRCLVREPLSCPEAPGAARGRGSPGNRQVFPAGARVLPDLHQGRAGSLSPDSYLCPSPQL